MKKILYGALAICLLSPALSMAAGADYDTLSEMAAEITASDFIPIFDASEADGSRMKKISFDGTVTNCLTGLGTFAAFEPSGAAAAVIAAAVTESDTTHCPDGASVFAALAGKQASGSYETAWGTVTTRDDDATPLVTDHGIYSLTSPNNADCTASTDPYACCTGSGTGTCTGAMTVTDFVDADGDHSDFVAGDQVILILSDADITLDCSENANLECFGGNDFTASATQITSHHFTFDGTRWVGPSMPMSSPTTLALSGIQAPTPVVGDPDTVTFTTAGTNLYMQKFIANAAGTYAHSGAISVGENWVIEAQAAVAVAVTINAADTIMLNGVSCAQGVGVTSDSTAAAFATFQYQAANTIDVRGASFTCTP